MIFSVQRFVEDYLERRRIADIDDYAIGAATAFERAGTSASEEDIAQRLRRIRTALFRRNADLNRTEFERQLARALKRRFPKKKDVEFSAFISGLEPARRRIRSRRRSIASLLAEFGRAVESRAIDAFWNSRTKGKLRARPESIAQGLLAVFAKAVVGSDGVVLREFASGIGFVDVGVSFGGPLHLIELKILTGKLVGVAQLGHYMKLELRETGWLVLVDVRKPARRSAIPPALSLPQGIVRTVVIDANPIPPHSA